MDRFVDVPALRVGENCAGGRDFVVGDVHGEFGALEAVLVEVDFTLGRDRLFALGDLVDRGPRSADALAWLESARIALSVRGNHEEMLLGRIRLAENHPGEHRWGMHSWFPRDVARSDWGRWKKMLRALPIAVSVATAHGAVGLVHAAPTTRHWDTMLGHLAAGDPDTMSLATSSSARARHDTRRAGFEGVPVEGRIDGVRAVLTGHAVGAEPFTTANVWHIDTGAGFPNGCLTLARIDVDPIDTLTVPTG